MKLRALPVLLAAALANPGLVPHVSAQETVRVAMTSGGDFGMPARVSRKSVEKYADLLSLSPDQKSMAVSLHEGYDAAVQSAQKDFQAQMQEMQKSFQDSQDSSVWTERMPKARAEYQGKTKSLEKGLFDDLKALLTTEQQGKWSVVERYRRRETVLRSGMLAGENVDLISVVEGLKLGEDAGKPLAQPLEEYELELDRALLAKQNELNQGPGFEPGKPFDPQEMRARLDKAREQGQKIKDINQRNARRIEGLLPEEKKADFAKAVREASFPRVYRPSAVTRKLDAAMGLSDLEPRQREALQDLRSSYHRDLGPLNDRWASAIEDQEKTGAGGGMMAVPGVGAMQVNFGGEDDKSPLAEARKARRALDDKTREKLDAVLTKEQKDRLPKESGPGDDGQHMMVEGGLSGAAPIIIRKTEDR